MRHTQLGDVSEGHWHTRCTHQFQILYIFERCACGFTEFDNNINLLITIAEYSCLCAFKRIACGEGDLLERQSIFVSLVLINMYFDLPLAQREVVVDVSDAGSLGKFRFQFVGDRFQFVEVFSFHYDFDIRTGGGTLFPCLKSNLLGPP